MNVLLGRGDGTFGAYATYLNVSNGRLAGVADIDGDGKPDLVTASSDFATLNILRGKGDGFNGTKGSSRQEPPAGQGCHQRHRHRHQQDNQQAMEGFLDRLQ